MGEVIYFISDGGRAIKVGRSRQVGKRFRHMQSGNSTALEYLGCTDGGFDHEQEMFRRLAAYRLRGEWFADCSEVRAAVTDAIKNGIAVEPRLAIVSGDPLLEPGWDEGLGYEILNPQFIEDIRTDRMGRAQLALEAAQARRKRAEQILKDMGLTPCC
jgi:hypothetical protein